MDDTHSIASFCRALSVETRVHILEQLRQGPLCVGALASRLGVSQSAVSQHLRVLRSAGLVSSDRRGFFIHYRLNEAAVQEYLSTAKQLLLGGKEAQCPSHSSKGGEPACARQRRNAKSPRT